MSFHSVWKRADVEEDIPNGCPVVIMNFGTSTIRAFNDSVDTADDVLGIKIDKSNTLMLQGLSGLVYYDTDTWTWGTDLVPVYSGPDQVPNPNAAILNPFSNTELEIVITRGFAPVLKTVSPSDLPGTWKLVRSQDSPALHDIYLL